MAKKRRTIVLFIKLIIIGINSSFAQLLSPYNTSFESGQGSWSILIQSWDCPCPEAKFNFSSANAKRSGDVGLEVSIRVSSVVGWHVQARSPYFNLTGDQTVAGCIWLRAGEDLGGSKLISFGLVNSQTFETLGEVEAKVHTQWAQFCIAEVTLDQDVMAYFALGFGANTGTVFVDDMSVTAGALPSPTTPPASRRTGPLSFPLPLSPFLRSRSLLQSQLVSQSPASTLQIGLRRAIPSSSFSPPTSPARRTSWFQKRLPSQMSLSPTTPPPPPPLSPALLQTQTQPPPPSPTLPLPPPPPPPPPPLPPSLPWPARSMSLPPLMVPPAPSPLLTTVPCTSSPTSSPSPLPTTLLPPPPPPIPSWSRPPLPTSSLLKLPALSASASSQITLLRVPSTPSPTPSPSPLPTTLLPPPPPPIPSWSRPPLPTPLLSTLPSPSSTSRPTVSLATQQSPFLLTTVSPTPPSPSPSSPPNTTPSQLAAMSTLLPASQPLLSRSPVASLPLQTLPPSLTRLRPALPSKENLRLQVPNMSLTPLPRNLPPPVAKGLPQLTLTPSLTPIRTLSRKPPSRASPRQNFLLNTSFEAGPGDWQTMVRNWDCPCPTATFNFNSSAAAHTGSKGLEVNVKVASNQGFHVQLQTPTFRAQAGRRYTACLWLRSDEPLTGRGCVWINLIKLTTYDLLVGLYSKVSTNWTHVCLGDMQTPNDTDVRLTVDMGVNTGTYYLDDFSLTVSGNASGIHVAPFSTSYEASQADWVGSTKDMDCPCPTASFNYSSTAAARTSSTGIEVVVTVPSLEVQDVQLRSPQFSINTSFMYTACVWLRTPGGLPTGNHVPLVMVNATNYGIVMSSQALVTSVWSQACIMDFRPSTDSTVVFTLDLGRLTGSVFVDDFTFTARADYPPEELEYVSHAAITDRIDTHRKGNLTFRFVNATTGEPVNKTLSHLELHLARHDFPFGTAIETSCVPNAQLDWYLGRAKRHFNALVPQWAFKWPSVEPVKNKTAKTYRYLLSNHLKFAASNDFVMVRGHTLEWLVPDRGFGDHWSRRDGCELYRSHLENRIKRDVTNFKGKFNSYDVFNEIVHDRDFVERCPGMWPSILHDGYRWAHEADPDARLCINDYGLVTGDDWQALIKYVSEMLAEGVPIHCIGVQAYVPEINRPTPAYMRPRLDALASLGLDILISEFNFLTTWYDGKPVWQGTEDEHARMYEEYIPFWFSLPYIKGILMWNFWDSTNWITNGGLYRADGSPKPAALAVDDMWNNRWRTHVDLTDVALDNGATTARGFYGKYNFSLEVDGRVFTGLVNFPIRGGAQQTVNIQLL